MNNKSKIVWMWLNWLEGQDGGVQQNEQTSLLHLLIQGQVFLPALLA